MRKSIGTLIIVVCILVSVILGFAYREGYFRDTIHVPDDYPTIQEAINAAKPGETIRVSKGIYYENIVVDKSVSLLGENKENTLIDGSGKGDVVNITADSVKLTGFKIINGGDNGIKTKGQFTEIYNNIISSNNESGIRVGSPNNTISFNNITFTHLGISVEGPDDNLISDNTCSNNYRGIFIGFNAINNVISYNVCINNTYGIDVFYGSNNIVTNNTCSKNDQGISMRGSDGTVTNNICHSNRIGISLSVSIINLSSNNCYDNEYGIYLSDSRKNIVSMNLISNNTDGIYLSSSSNNNTISNNNISKNVRGIYFRPWGVFSPTSNNNKIFYNNFIENTNQSHQHNATNTWNDGNSTGNYWSDYAGLDTNNDGIGDTKLPHQGVDWDPLMFPLTT